MAAPAGRRAGAHVVHLQDPSPPILGRGSILGRAPPLPLPSHPGSAAADHAVLPRQAPSSDSLEALRLPPAAAAAALEERMALRDREIENLLDDNQRLATTHVALKQELLASHHELRVTAAAASRKRAEREAELRELLGRAAVVEEEARATAALRAELNHVLSDVQQLEVAKQGILSQLQGLKAELAKEQAEVAQINNVRAEIETMQREIQKGRAAIEFEKRAHATNLEQSQLMENNMVTMAREIEKLRAELTSHEKKLSALTSANPAYTSAYGNSEQTYGGNSAYSMNQVQRAADANTQQAAASQASYAQQNNVQAQR